MKKRTNGVGFIRTKIQIVFFFTKEKVTSYFSIMDVFLLKRKNECGKKNVELMFAANLSSAVLTGRTFAIIYFALHLVAGSFLLKFTLRELAKKIL